MSTATQTPAPTIDDVARSAHVSVDDVKAALKDPASVTSDTLALVLEAIQEVGYVLPRTSRMPRLADGRPRTKSGLLIIDPKPLLTQGRQDLLDELAEQLDAVKGDPKSVPAWKALAREATASSRAADGQLDDLRPVRDGAMLSLYMLDGRRGIDQAAGMAATTFAQMRQRTDPTKLKHVDGAAEVLEDVAPRILRLTGYRDEAAVQQWRAAFALDDLGVPVGEITEAIDVTEGRFWQKHADRYRRPEATAQRRQVRYERSTPLKDVLKAWSLARSTRSVTSLGMPPRATNSLKQNGVTTVRKLVALSEYELRQLPDMGDAAVEHVKTAIRRAAASS